jgi:hypothetical protein
MVADCPPAHLQVLHRHPASAKQDAPLVRCGCQTIASPGCASLARSVPWKSGLFNAESAATAERAERIRTHVSVRRAALLACLLCGLGGPIPPA